MERSIDTRITINAQPEYVWKVLMNFESYPNWNPFIRSISGKAAVGQMLQANIAGMGFKPKVTLLAVNHRFQWLGHLWFKGLFDGAHEFVLTKNTDGTTTLTHRETFRGVLVGLILKKIERSTREGFQAMNVALKDQAERLASKG